MTKTIRSPVRWYGGKQSLARRIIEYFPEHHAYVEPFGGGASVLLNKTPAPAEIYNDLDERITRLFRVIRDHGAELARRLQLTPYAEGEHRSVVKGCGYDAVVDAGDEIEAARMDFVRWRQSMAGIDGWFGFGMHETLRGIMGVVSRYLSAIDDVLPQTISRLRTVQFMSRPAVDVIKKWDSPGTLCYCDPPYVHGTRTAGHCNVYGNEMTDADHRELAAVLRECSGKVVVSGYPSGLYDELFSGWQCVHFDVPTSADSGGSRERRADAIWLNYPPPQGLLWADDTVCGR